MQTQTTIHRLVLGSLCCALLCLGALAGFASYSMQRVLRSQQAHAESFVPAKRLTTNFEREILNARIFFIYYVTIQKPGALDHGWTRYHNAEQRLDELTTLIDKQPELANLREPAAKLRHDLDAYAPALHDTLHLVEDGTRSGPAYDAQVKEWAARGAVLVTDAGDVETLCFTSGEASTRATISTLTSASRSVVALFLGGMLVCLAGAFLLARRLRTLLESETESEKPARRKAPRQQASLLR